MSCNNEMSIEKTLLFLLFVSFLSIGAARYLHKFNVMPYVKSGDYVYPWDKYECIGGVMYRKGRSSTIVLMQDGSPRGCKTIMMKNGDFYNMGR